MAPKARGRYDGLTACSGLELVAIRHHSSAAVGVSPLDVGSHGRNQHAASRDEVKANRQIIQRATPRPVVQQQQVLAQTAVRKVAKVAAETPSDVPPECVGDAGTRQCEPSGSATVGIENCAETIE